MAYTNIWDDTKPTGSEAANTIDDLMRSGKVDIEQRFNDMFAMPSFSTDPLRLYGLKFTDAQDSVINLGDNGGPSRSLIVKNKAANATYLTINSTGLTVNGTITSGGITMVSGDLVLPGTGLGITNGTTRFLAIASGVNPVLHFASTGGHTFDSAITISAGNLTLTSGIAGFGQAPEANNAVAARGATNDNTSNIFLGRSAAGTTKFAVDSAGSITVLGSATISGNIILTGFYTCPGISLGFIGGSTDTQFKNSANNAANLIISDAGAITIRNGLTVSAGDAQFAAGLRQAGTVISRFENTSVTRPGGSTGIGIELGVSSGATLIQSYNVGTASFVPMLLQASDVRTNAGLTITHSGGDYGTIGYAIASTGVAGSYTYNLNDFASRLEFFSGGFRFYTAPSGVIGNAITFTQALSLTQSGVLLVGAAVVTGAATGDIVLANTKAIRGNDAANSTSYRLIFVDANNVIQVGDTGANNLIAIPRGTGIAASANFKGGMYMDTGVAGQLVYFDGVTGARYKLIGTAF